MRFYGKFHRELVEHFFGITVDDESYGIFGRNASLIAVEELLFRYFGSGGFVLYDGGVVVDVYVRKCVCSAGG